MRLEKTCDACPEQYDAFQGKQKVGYLRLRHGEFTVSFPDVNGKIIYRAEPDGDGSFTEEERDRYLDTAKEMIRLELMKVATTMQQEEI